MGHTRIEMNEQDKPDGRRRCTERDDPPDDVADHGRSAIDIIRAGVAGAREPIADRVGQVRDGVVRRWNERPGARVRRVRRMGRSRCRSCTTSIRRHGPRGRSRSACDGRSRSVAGTAVGGGAQRGGDFLPLRAFRGGNWNTRWQRLTTANDGLAVLPPIDVVKFGDRYWVVDGHNRVALALYGGQVAIDADVIELVPFGDHRTEPIGSLASSFAASRALRTAGSGRRPSDALAHEDDAGRTSPDDDG